MSRACRMYETLIDRRASGLSESERLLLDTHVATCEACFRTLRALSLVTQTLRNAPVRLSETARHNAIARALSQPPRPIARAARTTPRGYWLGSLALAALALCAVLGREYATKTQPSRAAHPAPASLAPHETDAPKPKPAPEYETVATTHAEERVFGHARVQLAAHTRVEFAAAQRNLTLLEGELEVVVDPQPGQRFTVSTAHFHVEVLGTAFRVSREAVSVQHGTVRVTGHDGKVYAAALTSGQTFRWENAQRSSVPERVPERASNLLQKARLALTQSKIEHARALIAQAERARPNRRERAEALTLLAECAMLARDLPTAARYYQDVAQRFATLPAGENAAFAAAQLALRTDDKSVARQRFSAYLTRYPHGRFAREARARLTVLNE